MKCEVPPEAKSLMWLPKLKGHDTIKKLREKIIHINQTCFFCNEENETIEHWFIQCHAMKLYGRDVWSILNLYKHCDKWPKYVLEGYRRALFNSDKRKLFDILHSPFHWVLWSERTKDVLIVTSKHWSSNVIFNRIINHGNIRVGLDLFRHIKMLSWPIRFREKIQDKIFLMSFPHPFTSYHMFLLFILSNKT